MIVVYSLLKILEKFGFQPSKSIRLIDPLSYRAFLNLWKDARLVLTDSGGLQEETTALGIPCLTIRETTERPITVSEETNEIMGSSRKKSLTLLTGSFPIAGKLANVRNSGTAKPLIESPI